MQIRKKIAFPVIVAIILIAFITYPSDVNADTGSLGASNSSPYIGSTITVTLSFSGSYQGLQGALTYEPSVVQYVGAQGSGSCSTGGGTGTVSYGIVQNPGRMYIAFTFKVIGPGSCTFSAISDYIIGADGSEDAGTASTTINASKAPAPSQPSTPSKPSNPSNPSKPPAQGGTEKPAEPETSSDAYLSSIDISQGVLSPAFSADIFTYKVYAGKNADYCAVTASARDGKARVDISGNSNLEETETERVITVTAQDGTQNEYRVTVIKDDPPEGSDKDKDQEKDILEIDGKKYLPVDKVDLKALPEGFKEDKITYKGKDLKAAFSKDKKLIMVPLKDKESGDIVWFLYDKKQEILTPADLIKIEGKNYIRLRSGLEQLYGSDGKGRSGCLIYDPEKKEFVFMEESEGSGKSTDAGKQKLNYPAYIGIGACVLLIILAVIQLALRKSRKKHRK